MKVNLNLREQNWRLLLGLITAENETSSGAREAREHKGEIENENKEKRMEIEEFWLRALLMIHFCLRFVSRRHETSNGNGAFYKSRDSL